MDGVDYLGVLSPTVGESAEYQWSVYCDKRQLDSQLSIACISNTLDIPKEF